MPENDCLLRDVRRFYARQMAAASRSNDPRIERAFEEVRREGFLPPGPWHQWFAGAYIETTSAHPVHLCQDLLVALDIRSAWLTADRAPDGSAVAILPEVWFSSQALSPC